MSRPDISFDGTAVFGGAIEFASSHSIGSKSMGPAFVNIRTVKSGSYQTRSQ